MTEHEHRLESILKGASRAPMSSKKFLAYLYGQASLDLLSFVILFLMYGVLKFIETVTGTNAPQTVAYWLIGLVMLIVFTKGFMMVGYVLGQASLDKFTRGFSQLNPFKESGPSPLPASVLPTKQDPSQDPVEVKRNEINNL